MQCGTHDFFIFLFKKLNLKITGTEDDIWAVSLDLIEVVKNSSIINLYKKYNNNIF